MAALIQLKVIGSGGKTVYLDNIYFYDNTGTALSENRAQIGVRLFPNPVKNSINFVSDTEIGEVFISNILGQIIKIETINTLSASIDLSILTAGQYFITVKQANGDISTQKLIKQ